MSVIPHRFLFRYAISVIRISDLPRRGNCLLDLPETCRLPEFGELDQSRPFGELRVAWNQEGIGVSVSLSRKKHHTACDPREPVESDGLQIWIDTRSTQTIHRASRFCHHFCLLPSGAGRGGTKATAVQVPIPLAREDAPRAKSGSIQVSREEREDGYLLEAWVSNQALHGFDPEANPRLGFYYYLRDAELGEQFLTVGKELPFAHDPSLWSVLELNSA